jgi:hypothetical protein
MLSLNCRLGDAQQCSLLLLLREMYTCVCKHMLYWHVCWRRVGDRGCRTRLAPALLLLSPASSAWCALRNCSQLALHDW